MPPVRWQVLTAIAVLLFLIRISTTTQIKETISMTADGWRPIIGSPREPVYHKEITHYRNPSQNSEAVKAETPKPYKKPSPAQPTTPKAVVYSSHSGKLIAKYPQINQYFTLPNHGHGPHIPLGAVVVNRPQIKKYPTLQNSINGKRHIKPIRLQANSHSSRDEIFVASPNSGAYTFYTKKPSTIKAIRDTPLGNHYSLTQPHSHVEFANRYVPQTNENYYQFNNPIPNYIFPKNPINNEIFDDFTRNLVPPPLYAKVSTTKPENKGQLTESPSTVIIPKIPDIINVPTPQPTFENKFKFPSKSNENVEVEVTKEKLKVFHNKIPSNFGDYVDYDYHTVKNKPINYPQTYEVTEGKPWRESQYTGKVPIYQAQTWIPPKYAVTSFLPTPYNKPDPIVPTSPTQGEVSTIYAHLSKLNQQKNEQMFDVKEVSTHYPITGKPNFVETQTEPAADISTVLPKIEEIVPTEPQKPRLTYRRRKPSRARTTTTEDTFQVETENYNLQKFQENETEMEREKPLPPKRRPIRYRTTTPPPTTTTTTTTTTSTIPSIRTRGTNKYKIRGHRIRPRPIIEETKNSREDDYYTTESIKAVEEESENIGYRVTQNDNVRDSFVDFDNVKKINTELITEPQLTTNYFIPDPENEIDHLVKVEEVKETTTPATTTTTTTTTTISTTSITPAPRTTILTTTPTTTTTETTTSKSNRIRGRPLKFDNSNRPRFSVKDYRQRLNQHSTTSTAIPSTEPTNRSIDNLKLRFPNRARRPLSTKAPIINQDYTETEPPPRSRFTPKDPRHGIINDSNDDETTSETIIADNRGKNNRLRPFVRQKSTTTTTLSPVKISIKPNLFAQRRRPLPISLRSRISSRYNKTIDDKKENNNIVEPQVEETTTLNQDETTTEYEIQRKDINNEENDYDDRIETTTTIDLYKNEAIIYSQRVSDLTSSSKNEYDTPGLFKAVVPNSRRIPNHFTMVTDDPILPIEAFFTNIREQKSK